ncbi:MAG: RHS repeat-associated core domain-containing protein [Candidatus Omnitrophica bacterium]|nr:RHS repeat-associated core domain-containing protein [Candidatus Omnitrophota bacterium]
MREREVAGGTKTRFHWEGLNLYLEEEWNGSAWVPKRAYINQPSALGGALARFDLGTSNTLDASDSGWFYHYDEVGNVILITDKNGGLIKHFEQDAWGNDLNGTFATTQNIRQHQTGKYLDETTGLYFFGARWYDPAIGRFISVSPLMPNEEEYAFCGNDPVNRYDGDGLLDEVVDYVVTWNEQLRMFAPDVASKGSPEKAKALVGGIEVGAECLILTSVSNPLDKWTAVLKSIGPTYRFLRRIPLLKSFLKPHLYKNISSYTTRITRNNFPGVMIKMKDGSVLDITPQRVKMFIPEYRAASGLRPVLFANPIPGSKGKKRVPTTEELYLLEYLTQGK